MSVNLGIKPIFSKYYKTVSFLLTVSLIPPPAGNEISSYAAYEKRNIPIIIQLKPEALISYSETGVAILLLLLLLFFFQLQNKMHAHLAGLIPASHVLEY